MKSKIKSVWNGSQWVAPTIKDTAAELKKAKKDAAKKAEELLEETDPDETAETGEDHLWEPPETKHTPKVEPVKPAKKVVHKKPAPKHKPSRGKK